MLGVLITPTKVSRVKDIFRQKLPRLIDLFETKKTEFTPQFLESLTNYGNFLWNWLPAVGTAGGF